MPMPQNECVPKVSVLMGVLYRRNDISLLCRSVESVLAQTIDDFEFLICDDGSTREATEYLERISKQDKRIRLIRKGNLFGLSEKLNACLRESRGSLIARMDDDDYSHPERFAREIAALEVEPAEIGFVGCNVNLVRNGYLAGTRVFPRYPGVRDFFITQPFIHPSLLFRATALFSVNGYSEEKRCNLCEDYDLLLRLYARGIRGINLDETLLDYTVPLTAKGSRTMKHRWCEAQTRFVRFRELGILPVAFPFVIKPLATGVLPEWLLKKVKECRD